MAAFFIDRPIFAWVLAIVVMLGGGLAIGKLAVEQYPTIAAPSVEISASYAGASAQVIEDSVTQVIERNMKGLDNLLYMSASSDSSGNVGITLTFATGTDPDIAQVQVQNKLQLALPLLPDVVQQDGVTVSKSGTGFLMVVGFVSEDGSMSKSDIADYVDTTLVDPLSRVDGVGSLQVFGSQYAMRIWLDPNKLNAYKIAPSEIIAKVRTQNSQVAVGSLGGTPAVKGQQMNASITAQGRLETPEQFRDIILRANADGSMLRLGDVARVEIGADNYGFISRYNRETTTGVAVSMATGANALETSAAVNAKLEELKPYFPPGLKAVEAFDTTPFVKVSIEGVVYTLIEAMVLVFLVMFLFLQNFRATLIPTIAVPVVLLGTLGILFIFGLSINMLTMFAMVLAIGLLVDDAIVVVENVERLMSEEGLSPREATRKSMKQITGALIGIGVVLSAVFVPMAFMGGSTGVIYQQFSVTIASAMMLSVLVAIIFTPALCATLLKPVKADAQHGETGFFAWFNRSFNRGNQRYQQGVGVILARGGRFLAIFVLLLVIMGLLFVRLPSSFLPGEDQGVLLSMVQAPVGATQERTMKSIEKLEDHFLTNEQDAVKSVMSVQGFSFAGRGQNNGIAFIMLKDWNERNDGEQSADGVAMRAMAGLSKIKDALVYAFSMPPMPELGVSAGFNFYIKDNGGLGHVKLTEARNQLLGAAAQSPLLMNVRPNGQEDTPQLQIDLDNAKAMALGVSIDEIKTTLSVAWGGRYIDDFIDRGRVKRVRMQADAPFRMVPEDFRQWSVPNVNGDMVPLSALIKLSWVYGSPRLERYNGVPAMEMQGEAAQGVSSGDAMAEVERLAAELPAGVGIEWTGLSYQEREAGSQTTLLYTLSLLIVFLCLAALYESWIVPTAVMLAAPLGILGAVLANTLRGMERDIYFQVAMLTTVGLTSKNAILIVEFAKQNLEEGVELVQATMQAVRDRLRPIIMTSLAFGLGVLPLAISSGAGSGAQRAVGTGVLGGMLVGTLLGIFFVPLFFVVIQRIFAKKPQQQSAPAVASHKIQLRQQGESVDIV